MGLQCYINVGVLHTHTGVCYPAHLCVCDLVMRINFFLINNVLDISFFPHKVVFGFELKTI